MAARTRLTPPDSGVPRRGRFARAVGPGLFLALAAVLVASTVGVRATPRPERRSATPPRLWIFFHAGAPPESRLPDLAAAGARVRHVTRWLNGVSAVVPEGRIEDVLALPFVRSVRPVARFRRPAGRDLQEPLADAPRAPGRVDRRSTPTGPPTSLDFAGDEAWHYGPSFNQNAQVGILDLHRLGYTGAGVTVAIFDTGFRTGHAALAGRRLVAERDFVNGDGDVDNEPGDPLSAWNHGTSVWSNVGGFRPGALVGGAFEADILLAKTEDVSSETPIEEDNYVAALEWADSLGADIVTASLVYLDFDGTGDDYTYADLDGNTTILARAVDIAVERGLCVVNAVGNFGPGSGTLWTPADADSVLSVGAVDSFGVVAGFSSRGPTADGRFKPEVVARGVRTWVASATTGGYGPANGTSFATPVTAGAAALLKEAHPTWSGWDLREAIRSTASHAGTPDNTTGYGLVSAIGALVTGPGAPAPPRMSRPFALEAPPRNAVVSTAAPEFRWSASVPGAPDVVSYEVVLAGNAAFAGADTFAAGSDTTWIAPAYFAPGDTVHWTVVAENGAGYRRAALRAGVFTVSPTVGVEDGSARRPALVLGAPDRLPTRSAVRLAFTLPATDVPRAWSANVVAVDGRRVRRLASGAWGPASSPGELRWDLTDDSGRRVADGVYFVTLAAGRDRASSRVVVVR
jgi:serine protease AprX